MTPTLTYRSPKLGEVQYSPDDVVQFPDGLPGFEQLRDFLIVSREECTPFVFLASLDEPGVALPLVPWRLVGVQPVAGANTAGVAAWAVVSIGHGPQDSVANLRAPVVIDLDARLGRQVILADEKLPLAAPVGD
jgi:flagellar assembly factor FliW